MREREFESPGSATSQEQTRTRQQNVEQSSSVGERAKDLREDTQKRLQQANTHLEDLQDKRRQLSLDPKADREKIEALDEKIDRQERTSGRLEARDTDLQRLERLYPDLDTRGQKAAQELLQRFERDRDLANPWVASLDAQSRSFQRPELQAIRDDLDQQDASKAVADIADRLQRFEQRGLETKEMAEVGRVLAQELDVRAMVAQLREILNDFDKGGLLEMEPLEKGSKGRSIAEIPELKAVWDVARDDSTNYSAVRTEFWKLMHPDYRSAGATNADMALYKEARDFVEAAGYTFEDSRPGAAPRLVADQALSRNDYTLSLQHDFPQQLIKQGQGELDKLLTDPANLRFTTTRDNLQEDSVRFGRSGSWMGQLDSQVQGARDDIYAVAKSELSQRDLKTVERALQDLTRTAEWEREALRMVAPDFQSLSELRARHAVEGKRLENLIQQSAPEEQSQYAQREQQTRDLEGGVAKLEGQNELVRHKITDQLGKTAQEFRELMEDIDTRLKTDGWARVKKEMEDRLKELEAEYELPAKK